MTRRVDSGSSRSPIAVEPETSQKHRHRLPDLALGLFGGE
jgi:hypothetical protein